MICFLEGYYNKTLSDDLGSLLGDLQLLDDGGTADPAVWYDWMKVTGDCQVITILDSFKAVIAFLNDYYARTSSFDIKILLNNMQQKEEKEIMADTWDNWIKCVNQVIQKDIKW